MQLFARLAVAGALVGGLAAAGRADVIYDSKGFEELQGYITEEGLDGWYPVNGGIWPFIRPGPPSEGFKSVELRMMGPDGPSGMYRYMTDPRDEGFTTLTVRFDVYRQTSGAGWYGDLDWRLAFSGEPGGGGQYSLGLPTKSRTLPLTRDPHMDEEWAETELDAWGTVELVWDFENGIAIGYYNGALVSEKKIENLGSIDSFGITLFNGEAPGLDENAWIDNLVIYAEKGRDCYADCDYNHVLDLFDFLCFTNEFNAGTEYADCDASGSLDLFDFLCLVNSFSSC